MKFRWIEAHYQIKALGPVWSLDGEIWMGSGTGSRVCGFPSSNACLWPEPASHGGRVPDAPLADGRPAGWRPATDASWTKTVHVLCPTASWRWRWWSGWRGMLLLTWILNLNWWKVSSHDRTTTRRKMIKTTKRMKRRMMTMPVLVTTTALAMEQIWPGTRRQLRDIL